MAKKIKNIKRWGEKQDALKEAEILSKSNDGTVPD